MERGLFFFYSKCGFSLAFHNIHPEAADVPGTGLAQELALGGGGNIGQVAQRLRVQQE